MNVFRISNTNLADKIKIHTIFSYKYLNWNFRINIQNKYAYQGFVSKSTYTRTNLIKELILKAKHSCLIDILN